jgi:hypothetical protein
MRLKIACISNLRIVLAASDFSSLALDGVHLWEETGRGGCEFCDLDKTINIQAIHNT